MRKKLKAAEAKANAAAVAKKKAQHKLAKQLRKLNAASVPWHQRDKLKAAAAKLAAARAAARKQLSKSKDELARERRSKHAKASEAEARRKRLLEDRDRKVRQYLDSVRDKDKWIFDTIEELMPTVKTMNLKFQGKTAARRAARLSHHRNRNTGHANYGPF